MRAKHSAANEIEADIEAHNRNVTTHMDVEYGTNEPGRRVRTRYAPSPTGLMHIGGLRTFLYNYLFAKMHGGDMLLRIEDTDKKREVEGSIDDIVESLKWAGMDWDEGFGSHYEQRGETDKRGLTILGPNGPYL